MIQVSDADMRRAEVAFPRLGDAELLRLAWWAAEERRRVVEVVRRMKLVGNPAGRWLRWIEEGGA